MTEIKFGYVPTGNCFYFCGNIYRKDKIYSTDDHRAIYIAVNIISGEINHTIKNKYTVILLNKYRIHKAILREFKIKKMARTKST